MSASVRRVLVNDGAAGDAPTAANILDALGMLRNAQANDTVLMFLSGHGMNEGLNYNFLATDAAYGDRALRNSHRGAVGEFSARARGRQGPPHPVPRHLPRGQQLQPAARQR